MGEGWERSSESSGGTLALVFILALFVSLGLLVSLPFLIIHFAERWEVGCLESLVLIGALVGVWGLAIRFFRISGRKSQAQKRALEEKVQAGARFATIAHYLGAHPSVSDIQDVLLWLTSSHLCFETPKGKEVCVPLEEIVGLEVGREEEIDWAKVGVSTVALFTRYLPVVGWTKREPLLVIGYTDERGDVIPLTFGRLDRVITPSKGRIPSKRKGEFCRNQIVAARYQALEGETVTG